MRQWLWDHALLSPPPLTPHTYWGLQVLPGYRSHPAPLLLSPSPQGPAADAEMLKILPLPSLLLLLSPPRGKVLALELLKILLENSGPSFRHSDKFITAIRQYLCVSLLKNIASSVQV